MVNIINRKMLISAGLAILGLIISAVFLYAKALELTGGGMKSVIVARQDVPVSTMLMPEMVVVKKIPSEFVEPGAVRDKAEIGSTVNVLPLMKGEQLIRTKLEPAGVRSGLSPKIVEGKRGVSVDIDLEDMAGGLIQPNDRVDILATFDLGTNDVANKETRIIFQNVMVIAVGESISKFNDKEKDVQRSRSKAVGFQMDPDDAGKLVLAKESAKISLALRAPGDDSILEGETSSNIGSILGRDQMIYRKFKEYRGR